MKTISFFSYKGGSGRTSLAYNNIPLIAQNLHASPTHPLVVMDMDIDSAGLSFLYRNKIKDCRLFVQNIYSNIPGILDDRTTIPEIGDHPFFKALIPIGDLYGMDEKSILFMPANTENSTNIELDTYNLKSNPLKLIIENIYEEYECCGVILDCPTGKQMTATASLKVSDIIVLVMRITAQFRNGTYSYLKWFDSRYSDKRLIIAPNAVPNDEITLENLPYDYEAVKYNIQETIADILNEHGHTNTADFTLLENGRFGVPEVVRFKFKEDVLLLLQSRRPDEEKALQIYRVLSDAICKG